MSVAQQNLESRRGLTELERPDAAAGKALAASVVGYAMDGFDFLILAFMLTAIRTDLGLSPAVGGSLATWTLVGAVAGGILFGVLSDYYGRVRVLTWTILIFAVFTGLCALAQGYWDLVAYRAIAGLGLGGEFGIGMALVAEAWPARLRARACSYVGIGWQVGVLLAAFVTAWLLPHIGWRGMFLVGLFPGVIAFLVRWYVGEPRIFVERATRTGLPLKLLVKDAATTKISLGMLILCSVQNFGYYGLMIWLPSYLASRFGYSSQLTDPTALLVGGAVMGVFVNGMLGGYGALLSELYPTQARGTAENVLFNLGRGVGGFGPLVVGALVATYSFQAAIALLASIYVIDIIATALLIPERKGAPLE